MWEFRACAQSSADRCGPPARATLQFSGFFFIRWSSPNLLGNRPGQPPSLWGARPAHGVLTRNLEGLAAQLSRPGKIPWAASHTRSQADHSQTRGRYLTVSAPKTPILSSLLLIPRDIVSSDPAPLLHLTTHVRFPQPPQGSPRRLLSFACFLVSFLFLVLCVWRDSSRGKHLPPPTPTAEPFIDTPVQCIAPRQRIPAAPAALAMNS